MRGEISVGSGWSHDIGLVLEGAHGRGQAREIQFSGLAFQEMLPTHPVEPFHAPIA